MDSSAAHSAQPSPRAAAPPALTALAEPSTPHTLIALESLAIFLLGFALQSFFYHGSTFHPEDEIGVPEYDSYYHMKMAAMLPQVGLMKTFPWLQYAYFRQQGDDFVSHHVGFQVFLMPFVLAAKAITGDYMAGGRWAMAFCLGANLVLFNLLLRAGRVPCRWLWIALFLFMPEQFFGRHAYIRAIGISLIFLQWTLLMLFTRRYVWAGLVIALYVHVYLGSVLYAPLLVAIYAGAQLIGPPGDRAAPWKMIALTAAGWLLGVLTYPYAGGMYEFLKLQVFGTGLTPDIEVGQEWRPYTDSWFFVQQAALLLSVWVAALCLRLRRGPALSAAELSLLIYNFVFMLLTFKARRFIEYWPPFCLLSAAFLSRPVLAELTQAAGALYRRTAPNQPWLVAPALLALFAAAGGLLWYSTGVVEAQLWWAEWRVWSLVLATLLLAPLAERVVSSASPDYSGLPWQRLALLPAVAAALIAIFAGLSALRFGAKPLEVRLPLTGMVWLLAIGLIVVAPLALAGLRRRPATPPAGPLWAAVGGMVGTALLMTGAAVSFGAPHLQAIAKGARCYYELSPIRELMAFLKKNSAPGDIVFTDDWDIFPVFFYHNTHNRYIVGLDPKFTHERRPDLWERYVRLTRAQTPIKTTYTRVTLDGRRESQTIDVELDDIRDQFNARFVVTDRDHRGFAAKLARATDVAELIYPCRNYDDCRHAPYLLFRMRTAEEQLARAHDVEPVEENGRMYLSRLKPVSASQGWGTLGLDLSVDSQPLRLRGRTYARGLGTHAPGTLVYAVPPGYSHFEAIVGIDDETEGQGSAIVRVLLDNQPAFESPILTGAAPPTVVRLPLKGAKQIQLVSEATEDGQRFDHVNWADACFLREAETVEGARSTAPPPRAAQRARAAPHISPMAGQSCSAGSQS